MIYQLRFTQQRLIVIRDNWKYPLATIEVAENQKKTNIGGLAKVTLTVNIDIQDQGLSLEQGVVAFVVRKQRNLRQDK